MNIVDKKPEYNGQNVQQACVSKYSLHIALLYRRGTQGLYRIHLRTYIGEKHTFYACTVGIKKIRSP